MGKLWWLPIIAVLLSVFGFSPFTPTDVAQLAPVQTIVISAPGGLVRVDCGEKLTGQGQDLMEALEDLKAGVEGEVFLATAQQIVVVGGVDIWSQLVQAEGLRPAARLYQSSEPVRAADITGFLLRDKNTATLLELRIARLYGRPLNVPLVARRQGGYRIVSGKPI